MTGKKERREEDELHRRVILHIDLDCFYAQVEHLRLGIPLTVPLAVQQWNRLIAVNYAARAGGVRRHASVQEALQLHPQLRLVHVPTYAIETSEEDELVVRARYHDEMPSFRADGSRVPPRSPDLGSHKSCLEPYRQASLAIFRLLREWGGTLHEGVVVEKGGLDEAFIDVTDEVDERLIDKFAERFTIIRDELTDVEEQHLTHTALDDSHLSWIERELDWTGLGAAVPCDRNGDEKASVSNEKEPVNDDPASGMSVEKARCSLSRLRIWMGAQLARELRTRLRSNLHYCASVGIAPNKMLAKLASAMHKPDQQTWITANLVLPFMHRVPFAKIRMMGGKIGRTVLKGGGEERNGHAGTDNAEMPTDDSDDDSPAGRFSNRKHTAPTHGNIIGDVPESDDEDAPPSKSDQDVMAADLWPLSQTELAARVGDSQTAAWIFKLIRGIDASPVTERGPMQSFMSAKSFRPAVRDWPVLHDWCLVLVGELWARVQEERELTVRWPSTVSVYWRTFVPGGRSISDPASGMSRSCEFPHPAPGPLKAAIPAAFLDAVVKLLRDDRSGRGGRGRGRGRERSRQPPASPPVLFPMGGLSVSVSNFRSLEADGRVRSSRLDYFFIKTAAGQAPLPPPSMASLFSPPSAESAAAESTVTQPAASMTRKRPHSAIKNPPEKGGKKHGSESGVEKSRPATGILRYFAPVASVPRSESTGSRYHCDKCRFSCATEDQRAIQEHADLHFAMQLAQQP